MASARIAFPASTDEVAEQEACPKIRLCTTHRESDEQVMVPLSVGPSAMVCLRSLCIVTIVRTYHVQETTKLDELTDPTSPSSSLTSVSVVALRVGEQVDSWSTKAAVVPYDSHDQCSTASILGEKPSGFGSTGTVNHLSPPR